MGKLPRQTLVLMASGTCSRNSLWTRGRKKRFPNPQSSLTPCPSLSTPAPHRALLLSPDLAQGHLQLPGDSSPVSPPEGQGQSPVAAVRFRNHGQRRFSMEASAGDRGDLGTSGHLWAPLGATWALAGRAGCGLGRGIVTVSHTSCDIPPSSPKCHHPSSSCPCSAL